MRLYSFDLSPHAARCRLAIYKKGLPVEIVPPPGNDPRSDEYRLLNPLAKVPALVLDNGAVIPESEVIVEFLEDAWPDPPLRPDLPEARARMRLLARIGDLYLMPPIGRLVGQMRVETRDEAVVDAAMNELGKALDSLEHFIAPEGWAAGEAFSLADCALPPILLALTRLLPGFGRTEPLGPQPRTAAYWRRAQADPVVARVIGEMEADIARRLGQQQQPA
jgi:glutathione S-transferase